VPLFQAGGEIWVIFVRRGGRIRIPSGGQRRSRKRVFLCLDAELIFIMRVDALIAEKAGCLLSERKPLTSDRESYVPFPGRLAKCTVVCRCHRSVCSGPFYCSTWPMAHTPRNALSAKTPFESCIFVSSAVLRWRPQPPARRSALTEMTVLFGGAVCIGEAPSLLTRCAFRPQVGKAAQRNGQRTGNLCVRVVEVT